MFTRFDKIHERLFCRNTCSTCSLARKKVHKNNRTIIRFLIECYYLGPFLAFRTALYHYHSLTHWNAWPATGRSALQDLRSCAILQASLAFSPASSSICCTHVRQGRPRWRFHSGLMSGLPPARVSTDRRSAEWAGVASGSRRTWPKMESRLRLRMTLTLT